MAQQWRRELLPCVPMLLIVVPDPPRRHMMRQVMQEDDRVGGFACAYYDDAAIAECRAMGGDLAASDACDGRGVPIGSF